MMFVSTLKLQLMDTFMPVWAALFINPLMMEQISELNMFFPLHLFGEWNWLALRLIPIVCMHCATILVQCQELSALSMEVMPGRLEMNRTMQTRIFLTMIFREPNPNMIYL